MNKLSNEDNTVEELLMLVANYVCIKQWKDWRDDARNCKACGIYESDIAPCFEHRDWERELEVFDKLRDKLKDKVYGGKNEI